MVPALASPACWRAKIRAAGSRARWPDEWAAVASLLVVVDRDRAVR